MKKLLLALTFLAAGTFAYAQETNPNAAEITFEKEVMDYGTIDKGSDGSREFVFTNTGKEPLIITKAVGSCGCTVPTWPREPIAPGESAVMRVKYDTQRVGAFHKSVTVTSNASNPTAVVKIKGTVKAPQPVQTTPVKEEKTSMMEEAK